MTGTLSSFMSTNCFSFRYKMCLSTPACARSSQVDRYSGYICDAKTVSCFAPFVKQWLKISLLPRNQTLNTRPTKPPALALSSHVTNEILKVNTQTGLCKLDRQKHLSYKYNIKSIVFCFAATLHILFFFFSLRAHIWPVLLQLSC